MSILNLVTEGRRLGVAMPHLEAFEKCFQAVGEI